jgi:hypothetical protein
MKPGNEVVVAGLYPFFSPRAVVSPSFPPSTYRKLRRAALRLGGFVRWAGGQGCPPTAGTLQTPASRMLDESPNCHERSLLSTACQPNH